MRSKPDPTLADRFLAASPAKILMPGRPKYIRAMQAQVRRAEKFVFDTDATRRVGQIVLDIPDLMLGQVSFARAPFDLCWLEYPTDALDPACAAIEPAGRMGVLCNHNRISIVRGNSDGTIFPVPFAYHLNTEWAEVDQQHFCQQMHLHPQELDLLLWAPATVAPSDSTRARLRALRDTTMVELLVPTNAGPVAEGAAWDVIKSIAGEPLITTALLLLLNQPRATHYVKVPPRRGWINSKPKPYMGFHNVTVSLAAKEQTIALSEGNGTLRRRHQVRGHFCHDQKARDSMRVAGCIHEWQACHDDWTIWRNAPPDEVNHWACPACAGKRWWRAAHVRGDASKGYVDHPTYRVKAME